MSNLILPPGLRSLKGIKIRDIAARIEAVINQVAGVRFIVLIGPRDDKTSFYATRSGNMEKQETIEMMRMALHKLEHDDATVSRAAPSPLDSH